MKNIFFALNLKKILKARFNRFNSFFILLFFFILAQNLNAAKSSEIEEKIKERQDELQLQTQKAENINKKLASLGAKVNENVGNLQILNKEIAIVESALSQTKKEYSQKAKQAESLLKNQERLFARKKYIEDEIIKLLASEISISLVLNRFSTENTQDFILEESFSAISDSTKRRVEELSSEQLKIVEELKEIRAQMAQMAEFLEEQNAKRAHLKELQGAQNATLKKYKAEISQYNSELDKISQERSSLQEILNELNIIKTRQAEAIAQELQEKAARERAKNATAIAASAPQNFAVRQVASSYHNIATTKYRGERTISPLEKYEIERKFGPYFDPVYKMKVFNESITLRNIGDDRVKSVMDGKIVFAKDTPVLKKVVIVEHRNNMHTIYAQLDKIAPTIKPGQLVKKGYIIGRVDGALKFEVTIKDKHIDPLDLIARK